MGSTNLNHDQRFVRFSNLTSKLQRNKRLPLIIFVLSFAAVGVVMLIRSFALSNSTINGTLFDDANRNTVQDAGEAVFADKQFWINKSTGTNVGYAVTDSAGKFSLSGLEDGDYKIIMSSNDWDSLRNDWVPTTTNGNLYPEQTVTLTGTASVNFGIRKIVRSTDANKPITSYAGTEGMKVYSYNDVLSAQDIYDELRTGTLIGAEAGVTTVRFDLNGINVCHSSYTGTEGAFTSYSATVDTNYLSWLTTGNKSLFHEYGHAWSNYFNIMVQQTESWLGYLQARGLAGDTRVSSNVYWDPKEMIAEDYRQLFGSGRAITYPQANTEIPLAKDVSGLREYLSGPFMTTKSTTSTPSAPTNLTANVTSGPEGPAVELNWTASTGSVDHYDVYRADGNAGFVKVGFANSPSTAFYDSSNLSSNTKYTYKVRAVGSSGQQSNDSNSVSVTTPSQDTQKPSAPNGLTSPSQTSTSITLQWLASTDNVGVKEYRIYLDSRNLLPALKGTATGTSFIVTGLKSRSGYTFYVTAIDAAGNESLPSKPISVKTKR